MRFYWLLVGVAVALQPSEVRHKPDLRRRSLALGPELTGAVFSSNIPALPHLSVMRSLLVKSAFLGRPSAGEPTFLPAYLETLHRLAPELAAGCASLWWPRGDGQAIELLAQVWASCLPTPLNEPCPCRSMRQPTRHRSRTPRCAWC